MAIDEQTSVSSIRHRTVKGVMAFGLRGLAIRVLGLVGSVVLARLLAPSEIGLIAFGLVLISFSGTIANGGLGAFLIQQPAPPKRRQLQVAYGFQLVMVIPIMGAFALVAAAAGGDALVPAVMSLSLPIAVMRIPPAIVSERDLNFRPVVRAEVFETVAYNVFAIGLVVAGMGVWGVAVATIGRAVVGSATLITLAPLPVLRPVFAPREVREMLRFGFTYQGVGLLGLARDAGANLVLATVAGLSAVGYWSIAWRLLQPVQLLIEPLGRVMFPSMARLTEQGRETAAPLERAVARTAILMGFPAVALAGTAPALVPVLFGPGWNESVATLSVATIGLLVYGPMTFCGTGYLLGIGDAGTVLRASGLYTLVWLAATVAFVPLVDTLGVGIGMVIAGIVAALYFDRVLRRTGAHALWAATVPVLMVTGAGAIALAISNAIGDPKAVALAASLAVAEGLYLISVMVLRRGVLTDLVGLVREGLTRGEEDPRAPLSPDGVSVGPLADPVPPRTVSVVIASCGHGHALPAVIGPVLGERATLEVIVVAHGGDHRSAELGRALRADGARVIALELPEGDEAEAFAAGLEAATGEFVLFLDPGLIPSPGLVAGHLRAHERERGVAVMGPIDPELAANVSIRRVDANAAGLNGGVATGRDRGGDLRARLAEAGFELRPLATEE